MVAQHGFRQIPCRCDLVNMPYQANRKKFNVVPWTDKTLIQIPKERQV